MTIEHQYIISTCTLIFALTIITLIKGIFREKARNTPLRNDNFKFRRKEVFHLNKSVLFSNINALINSLDYKFIKFENNFILIEHKSYFLNEGSFSVILKIDDIDDNSVEISFYTSYLDSFFIFSSVLNRNISNIISYFRFFEQNI